MADETQNNSNPSESDDTIDLSPDESGSQEETIHLAEDEPVKESSEFTQNLALTLPATILAELASNYIDYVQKDLEDRADRYKRYADGLKQTGLTADSPSAPAIPGGSDLVYPVLTESAINFQSAVISEIMPASGPVKINPTLDATLSTLEKAKRKQDFLNREITNKILSFKSELEKLLSQLPLAGNCYRKFWWSPRYNRFEVEFLPVDRVVVPFNCRSFYTASRISVIDHMSVTELRQRMRQGLYKEIELSDNDTIDEDYEQEPVDVNNQIEDKYITEPVPGYRTVFEIYCDLDLKEDEFKEKTWGAAPYILTIDTQSREVIGLYRNWAEDDKTGLRKDYIAEWGLIPWRGAYSIGLTHIAGPMARYLSGLLKVTIDAGMLSTTPWGLISTTRGVTGQNITLEPGQFSQVELAAGTRIGDAVMAVPFNAPPPSIFQLFEMLDKTTRGILQTSLDQIGLDNTTVPVGTQMARIEQGLKVFKAIYARMYESLKKELQIICRLYAEHMEPIPVKDGKGEVVYEGDKGEKPKIFLSAKDFEDAADLAPVSDPDVFSETQRLMKWQFAQQLISNAPQAPIPGVDYGAFARVVLDRLNVPDVDQFLPGGVPPSNDNPTTENVKMSNGQLPNALPDQDHIAHIASHLQWYALLGDQIIYKAKSTPFFIQHVKQHVTLYYAKQILDETNKLAGSDVSKWNTRDMSKANELAELIAKAHQVVCRNIGIEIQPVLQTLGSAQIELQKALQPPLPPSPEMLIAQAAQQKNSNEITTQNAKVQLEAQDKQNQHNYKLQELALKNKESDQKHKVQLGELAIKAATLKDKSEIAAKEHGLNTVSTMADIASSTASIEHQIQQEQNQNDFQAQQQQVDQQSNQIDQALQAQQQLHGQGMAEGNQALQAQQQAHGQMMAQQQQQLAQQQQAHAQQMAQQAAQQPQQPPVE